MITFIEGQLEEKQPTEAIILAGGLGYQVLISLATYEKLPDCGARCRLLTHFHVREDVQQLFGFHHAVERKMFLLLLGISGIGPRTALSILSGLPASELNRAVGQGDVKRLSSVPGIGKKTAERIIVELRDKLDAVAGASGDEQEPGDNEVIRDAVLALVSLGYKQADALKSVRQAFAARPGHTVESLIRAGLTGR